MSVTIRIKENKTNNRNLVKCINIDEKISGSSCIFVNQSVSVSLLNVTSLEDKVSPFLPSVHPKLRGHGVH